MSADKYRIYALECVQLAGDTADPVTRVWLIEMARCWTVLAEQAEKNLTTDLVYETPPSRAGELPVTQQQQQIQPKKED